MQADRTKPESVMVYNVKEFAIVPGTNEVVVHARSDDADIKVVNETVDVQTKVDAIDDTLLAQVNGFFRRIAADAIGVEDNEVTGDLFTTSSGA